MDLIGRKVYGFKFSDNLKDSYNNEMDQYIGKVGVITEINIIGTHVKITFDNYEHWFYPLDQVKEHLVPWNFGIAIIKNSVIIEVSDDGKRWYIAEVIAQLPDGDYVTTDLIRWKLGRELKN
jgi:hypothetical protein